MSLVYQELWEEGWNWGTKLDTKKVLSAKTAE